MTASAETTVPGRRGGRSRSLHAADRTARILALLPWVAARGGATIAEIEERFDYPHELLADLAALTLESDFHDTGSPFSAVAIDWNPADEHIHVRCPAWLSDPLRLNAEEAARLLTTGCAALSIQTWSETHHDGSEMSALERALAKLQFMLDDTKRGLRSRAIIADRLRGGEFDINADFSISVNLGDAPENVMRDLRQAVSERKRIIIDYYSYYRDELTKRAVDPAHVFNQSGEWYLLGWCHHVRDKRVFRVDRLSCLTVTDVPVSVDLSDETPSNFDASDLDRTVTIRLDRLAHWVAEHYPVLEQRDIGDGMIEVDLAVSALPWLARLLLVLGPHAEVVTDDPEVAGLRSSAAAKILKRYR